MFAIVQKERSIILQSDTSSAEIWPWHGGILNQWTVKLGTNEWQIVDGYATQGDFEQHCEQLGFKGCKLSPYVCRINHSEYLFGEKRYKIGRFELAGNALHGLLYDQPFSIIASDANDDKAVVELQYDYKATDAGYPFTYSISLIYELEPHNKLTITTKVTNTHSEAIPICDGWHPYFSLGKKVDDLQLEINANSALAFDDRMIPTGSIKADKRFENPILLNNISLDDCFVLHEPSDKPAARLINLEDNLQLSIFAITGYPYLQIYTPDHRKSIAIENLSAAPDAFNNKMGLTLLGPGQCKMFVCSYATGAATT